MDWLIDIIANYRRPERAIKWAPLSSRWMWLKIKHPRPFWNRLALRLAAARRGLSSLIGDVFDLVRVASENRRRIRREREATESAWITDGMPLRMGILTGGSNSGCLARKSWTT